MTLSGQLKPHRKAVPGLELPLSGEEVLLSCERSHPLLCPSYPSSSLQSDLNHGPEVPSRIKGYEKVTVTAHSLVTGS